jgi:hypothetical protein
LTALVWFLVGWIIGQFLFNFWRAYRRLVLNS